MKARFGLVVAAAVVLAWSAPMAAQFPPRGGGPPPTPKASAPIDLTGVWVSIVNEDWRWRMITAPRGDFPGLPLSPAGRDIAMAWDPKTDGSCKAFGAAAVMRMPTRLLHFGAGPRAGAPSLQGDSAADWQRTLPPNNPFGINFPGGPPPPPGGSLRVVTTNLSGGWLRRNGVPYSEKTTVTEFFDRFPVPDGSEWFVVTTQVVDPEYLLGRLVTSSHFRREPDSSKWAPKPCRT